MKYQDSATEPPDDLPYASRMMYLAVFIGGAFGSLLREMVPPMVPTGGLVTSTFAINLVACFAIGWLYAVRHKVPAHVLHLGAVGFCGGLSTFSSFVMDLTEIHASAGTAASLSAAAMEIAAGILAAAVADALARRLHGAAPA